MLENATVDGGDLNGGGGDPRQLAEWITGAASRVAQGLPLDHSGQWNPAGGKFSIPAGYGIENGRLVQDTQTWSSIYKGLLGTAGMATLGLLVGPTLAPTLEATMNAGVGATTAGTAPSVAGGAALVAGGAPPAAGGLASVAPWLKATAPIAATVANRLGQPSGSGSGVSSLDPALMSQLSTLMEMAQKRVASAQPVHDAAMSMAMRMAPTYAESPRLTQAIQDSTTPAPSGSYSAATLAALRNLAGGR